MTLRVHVDSSDPTPPFEQLRRQLDGLITMGTLEDGQRLPSVRQLAADLSLATGTVARAYAELEKNGLVLSRRGAGTRVTAPQSPASGGAQEDRLRELVDDVAREAAALGMTTQSLTAIVQDAMRSYPVG